MFTVWVDVKGGLPAEVAKNRCTIMIREGALPWARNVGLHPRMPKPFPLASTDTREDTGYAMNRTMANMLPAGLAVLLLLGAGSSLQAADTSDR